MQKSSTKILALQFIACLNILLFAGCSSTTQDLFADSLGVVPDSDIQRLAPLDETKTAINELTIKDPTARAALGREEIVPQEEKKKITPQSLPLTTPPKVQNTSPSTFNHKYLPPGGNSAIEKSAQITSVKLNQLYFDNQKKHSEDSVPTPLVKFSRANYTQSDSPQVIQDLSNFSPPISKLESLAVRANQKMTGGELPTYTLPFALIALGLIIITAALGYNWELKRVQAAEKNELAKKNLWNKGLTELLPPRRN